MLQLQISRNDLKVKNLKKVKKTKCKDSGKVDKTLVAMLLNHM